jgi:hypothetical protein
MLVWICSKNKNNDLRKITTMREQKYLTVKEVAAKIGASINSLRIWLKNDDQRLKKFPNAKKEIHPVFGTYWLIPESDLANLTLKGRGRPRKDESKA